MWAVLIFGFNMFSRLSNLLPPSPGPFHPVNQLTRAVVQIASDAVQIVVKWSKVVQCQERVVTTPLYAVKGRPLCPKQALLRVARFSPCKATDHLFAYKTASGLAVIIQTEFVKFLRRVLKKSGFDESIYLGHSMRRGGGGTWAFSAGVCPDLLHGDWSSDSYLQYLQFTSEDKLSVTREMAHV